MAIYIGILWAWGRDYLPVANVTWGVHPSEVLREEGVRDGDRILAVNGVAPKTLEKAGSAILIEGARVLTVERDGQPLDIRLSDDVAEKVLERNERLLFAPRLPFVVDSVVAGGNAEASGAFRKGDRILMVNGEPAAFFNDFVKAVSNRKGETIKVTFERDGELISVPVEVSDAGQVGLGPQGMAKHFEVATERYGFLAAVPAGIAYGWETLNMYVSSLKLLFTRSGASQIGGFGAIGSLFSPSWDWQRFWEMTAFLSIILAFMNILPIPALDGGHVMFLLYEMIFRRTPNQRVLEVAQMVGMVLLLGLLLYANGNDLLKALAGR